MIDKSSFSASRVPAAKRAALVARLNTEAGEVTNSKRRIHPRLPYAVPDLGVVVVHASGGEGRFLMRGRDISASGISFLHRGFLRKGTTVEVDLPALDGAVIRVGGRIAMCRHLQGAMHEIGVAFLEKIDLERIVEPLSHGFVPADIADATEPPLAGEEICFVDEPVQAKILEHPMRQSGLDPQFLMRTADAAGRIGKRSYDLAIYDLDGPEGAAGIDALRSAGYRWPVLSPAIQPEAFNADAAAWQDVEIMPKPYDSALLLKLMRSHIRHGGLAATNNPIHSVLPPADGNDDLVETFIAPARTGVIQMQSAAKAGDSGRLRALCGSIHSTAASYEFPQLGQVAAEGSAATEKEGIGPQRRAAHGRLSSLVPGLRPPEKAA